VEVTILIQAAGFYLTSEDPKGGSKHFFYRNCSENNQDDTDRQPPYRVFPTDLK